MPDPEPVAMKVDTRRPFSRGDAITAGIDPKLFRGSKFRRIFRGVYIDAGVPMTPKVRAEAALVPFHKSAFASHASAARIHGVPIPTLPDEHVTVLKAAHRRVRPDIQCHLRTNGRIVVKDGVRVSGYGQMFVELAELLSLVDLVVVGDNLVRHRRITCADLTTFCEASILPCANAALAAAAYVRDRVELTNGDPPADADRAVRAARARGQPHGAHCRWRTAGSRNARCEGSPVC